MLSLRSLIVAVLLLAGATLSQGASAAGPGEVCGGFTGERCERGLWCDPFPGTCGGLFAGVCVKPSPICTRIYRPVCGCDGRTYSNDCVRRARKVGKLHDGKC
ncbi:MAG: Kazal domain-containing protein [Hyphomicrobiaceae bacterium]|nr:MAG: Kazal domain-containing protein [Hyphomicrobiaceae bacterium]